MATHYDAIIIGTVAGGGTLALHLARAGNPLSVVLDPNCKTRDLDNLYVVDASCFVSASAVNPSLTIIANATRIANHLLAERFH